MARYEYKVCPAPSKGRKAAGVKGPEARFAHGLELVMNEMGAEGWDYIRSDILPSEERQGLTSSQTVYRSVLVFRRPLSEDAPAEESVVPAQDNPPAPQDPDPVEIVDDEDTTEQTPEAPETDPDDDAEFTRQP